jgi:hypothetical protein
MKMEAAILSKASDYPEILRDLHNRKEKSSYSSSS